MAKIKKSSLLITTTVALLSLSFPCLAQKSYLPRIITQEQFDQLSQGKPLSVPSTTVTSSPISKTETQPNLLDTSKRKNAHYYSQVYQTEFVSWGIQPQNAEGNIHLDEAWDQFEKNRDITDRKSVV